MKKKPTNPSVLSREEERTERESGRSTERHPKGARRRSGERAQQTSRQCRFTETGRRSPPARTWEKEKDEEEGKRRREGGRQKQHCLKCPFGKEKKDRRPLGEDDGEKEEKRGVG